MKAILLQSKNLDEGVLNLILLKQSEFTLEKKRIVSYERTISRLLKEAYLVPATDKKDGE